MERGYSKDVLRDLTVNGWRPFLITLTIVVILFGAMAITGGSNPLFVFWLVLVPTVYLMATLWAAIGYALFKTADGGLPRSNRRLLLSIVVLLVPIELLK